MLLFVFASSRPTCPPFRPLLPSLPFGRFTTTCLYHGTILLVLSHHGRHRSLTLSSCFLTSFVCTPLLLIYSISVCRLYSSLTSYASPHPLLLAMIHGLYRCLFAPRANRFAMMSSAPLASPWQTICKHSDGEIIYN